MKQRIKSKKWEAALNYQSLGLSIIPVKKDKKPFLITWTEYQTKRATSENINSWWSRNSDANPAMVTGKNGRYITLDVDVKNGVDGRKSLGPLPPTACYRTGSGGMQYIFNHPGFRVPTKAKVREGLDVRGDGGYALLPPSENEKGGYEWVVPLEDGVADAPDWLLEEIRSQSNIQNKVKMSEIIQGVPAGDRNDAACVFIGTLLHRFPQEEWGVVWTAAKAWNESNNKPPEKESILRTKFDAIAKKELAKRQGLFSANTVSNSLNTQKSTVLTMPMSLKELSDIDVPPADWDIEGLIEHGTPNMLSAAPNNFKTWLLDVIALSIASGEKLFGHFSVKQQGVLIVSEEDGVGMTKNRFSMLMGKGKKDLPVHLHIQKGFKLTDELVDQLLSQAKELQVTFVMFDSLRSVHLGDENNSQEMQKVMDLLMRFVREGITVLFTHHHRKKMRGFGAKQDSTGEESRGSTSINAAVHGHVTCEHKVIEGEDKLVITQPKLKCAQKLKPFQVGMVFGHDMDSAKFVYEGEYADDSTKELVKGKVISVLKSDGKWLNKRQLKELVKAGGDTTLNIVLKELIADNILVSKARSDVEKLSLSHTGEGAHNSNYYQLEENDDF